jgi:hypothetical protein
MSEEYDFPRMHKSEDWIEQQISDLVHEQVFEFFGHDEITDFTEEEIKELENFRDGYDGLLSIGYSNLINWWESETGEEENG